MRIIPNQSEKCFLSRLIKNGQKSIWLILRHRSEWIRANPKPRFQSRSIRINPSSDWSKPNYQSELIRMNPRSKWFGLILIENSAPDWFGFIRIDVSELIGIILIDFWPFFIRRDTKRFQIGSKWFALAWIQISEWIGIVLIDSEWISIRCFRQGNDDFY